MPKNAAPDTNDEDDQDLDPEVDEDTQDETDENDEDSDSDDDTGKTDDEDDDDLDDAKFEKRFKQLKGDTPKEYAKNLEEAYYKTSMESVRLAKELAKKNEDKPADKKPDDNAALDPEIAWAKGERQRQWATDLTAFKKQHPELDSDPILANELNDELAIVAEVYQRKNGYGISMAEGLKKAWSSLGYDSGESDRKERVASAAKDGGTRSKSGTGKQSAPKIKLSDKQIEVFMEMQQVDRSEAIKQLSAYAK